MAADGTGGAPVLLTLGRALAEVEQMQGRLERLATPQNTSKLTLVGHLLLVSVKLPAGILSGSVGLLNDALDTLLDGVSSLSVYWSLRADQERLVSRMLVLFILVTGLFNLFQAVRRTNMEEPVDADWFAFAATLASAVVCALLRLVQRFILIIAFCLAGYAAVRLSLIYQRHPFRERRGRHSLRLYTDGYYGRVRHPMTGTKLIFYLSLLSALSSGWVLLPLGLILTAALAASLVEEQKKLLPRFGD